MQLLKCCVHTNRRGNVGLAGMVVARENIPTKSAFFDRCKSLSRRDRTLPLVLRGRFLRMHSKRVIGTAAPATAEIETAPADNASRFVQVCVRIRLLHHLPSVPRRDPLPCLTYSPAYADDGQQESTAAGANGHPCVQKTAELFA